MDIINALVIGLILSLFVFYAFNAQAYFNLGTILVSSGLHRLYIVCLTISWLSILIFVFDVGVGNIILPAICLTALVLAFFLGIKEKRRQKALMPFYFTRLLVVLTILLALVITN